MTPGRYRLVVGKLPDLNRSLQGEAKKTDRYGKFGNPRRQIQQAARGTTTLERVVESHPSVHGDV